MGQGHLGFGCFSSFVWGWVGLEHLADPAEAQERIESADALVSQLGISYSAVELLQEAVERYLKGFLVARGWRLERIHDLNPLIEKAAKLDARAGTSASVSADPRHCAACSS